CVGVTRRSGTKSMRCSSDNARPCARCCFDSAFLSLTATRASRLKAGARVPKARLRKETCRTRQGVTEMIAKALRDVRLRALGPCAAVIAVAVGCEGNDNRSGSNGESVSGVTDEAAAADESTV